MFGTGVNLESQLLMLRFAFDTRKLHRVQIQTDTRNLRSQRAIESLGAKREGVLRRHLVTVEGYVRDTVAYSITDLDWPEVSMNLTDKLDRRLEQMAGAAALA